MVAFLLAFWTLWGLFVIRLYLMQRHFRRALDLVSHSIRYEASRGVNFQREQIQARFDEVDPSISVVLDLTKWTLRQVYPKIVETAEQHIDEFHKEHGHD